MLCIYVSTEWFEQLQSWTTTVKSLVWESKTQFPQSEDAKDMEQWTEFNCEDEA